ncbi:MAG: dephospho-CoA kinase [Chloroflexi bacterium]|jgi:dephospho-CoA kinase|nr:MAG: dephospho-CoA kinase [Chloroflexota bacterium]
MPLVIGVTGSIATGKTLVCETLVSLGAVHCDVDKLVHRMYDPGKPAFDRIVAIFGEDVIGEDGYINRRVLGAKVFGDADKMNSLTDAIGDMTSEVRKQVEFWRNDLKDIDTAVLEAVNYVERGHGQWCDVTWLIATDQDTTQSRLMKRNNLSAEDANQRLASQVSWETREPAADLVIHNNETEEELIDVVKDEYSKARDLFDKGELPTTRFHGWWEINRTY